VEALWTKERIIEVYLNVAELGKGIYGVERAAQEYYKKPASTLTRAEAAMLTSVLPNPARRNPVKPTPTWFATSNVCYAI
jgi:monofunctional biosynthetic peptidoglycan transglycosylase